VEGWLILRLIRLMGTQSVSQSVSQPASQSEQAASQHRSSSSRAASAGGERRDERPRLLSSDSTEFDRTLTTETGRAQRCSFDGDAWRRRRERVGGAGPGFLPLLVGLQPACLPHSLTRTSTGARSQFSVNSL
jgi:hypothetical protein